MGDIADMMLDGTLCEGCGEYIGDGCGYPGYCSDECAENRGAGKEQVIGGGGRTKVESSQIKSIGFDAAKSAMEVEFKPGSIYRYSNVTREVYNALMRSESKGRFFGQVIKSCPEKYPFTKIRGTDRQVQKEAIGRAPVVADGTKGMQRGQ